MMVVFKKYFDLFFKAIKNNSEEKDIPYEVLSEAVGAYNGKRHVGCAIKFNKEKTIYSSFLNEGIDRGPEADKRGGIIVFSTDVNAIALDKFINLVKQKLTMLANRLTATKKIDKVANDNNLAGWTVGHYFNGRYRAKNGRQFGEDSLSVEIIGVDLDTLLKISEELCRSFRQESVLVEDFSSGRVLFVNPD